MDPLSLAAAENMAVHVSWVPRRLSGATVRDDGRLLLVDSGLPCDTFNVVCGSRLTAADVAAGVADAVGHFRRVGRPFAWWVGPCDTPADLGEYLVAAGLAPAETETAMAADLTTVPSPAPTALRIERATTAEQLRAFAEVNAANWDPPDPHVLRFYELAAPHRLAADCPLRMYVGRVNGEAVAAAGLVVGGGVAGVYAVSTRAAHRRRGYAAAMMARLLADARAAGLPAAVLQAAAAGVGVYARVGFRPVGRFTEYKPA